MMSNSKSHLVSLLATVAFASLAATGCVEAVADDIAEDIREYDGDDGEGDAVDAAGDELFGLPALGEGGVFAPIPDPPGYPEGIVVVGDRVYVSGPATFGTAGKGPSEIRSFDLHTGTPKGTIVISGEDTSQEHALSCITSDAQGRLYALSSQLGVVRLTKNGNAFTQSIYAPLPADLAPCTPDSTANCSATTFDGPPLINDLAFDWAGNLYVTDSFQATIFRVPAGGGTPEPWFTAPQLEGQPFNIGLNGIRLSPDQKKVYVTVTLSAANIATGYVYAVKKKASPGPGDLELVHTYPAFEAPDGIAFGLSGNLYVTMAGQNGISVLRPNGTEKTRYYGPEGSEIPFDGPANIAFDWRGSLLVTNHASLSNNASNFAVLDLFVGDLAFPLAKPLIF
jgi:sugar lactone lactonase YvrE